MTVIIAAVIFNQLAGAATAAFPPDARFAAIRFSTLSIWRSCRRTGPNSPTTSHPSEARVMVLPCHVDARLSFPYRSS